MKRKAKIEISFGKRWPSVDYEYYWWVLIGANGERICTSETFTTRSNALRAARRAKALMVEAEIK